MKKLFLVCVFVCFFSCEKNNTGEMPCDIKDRTTFVGISIKSDSTFIIPIGSTYTYDSVNLNYRDSVYSFIQNQPGYGFAIKLPPEQEVNDTLFLNWYNIPDVDTLVLNYKAYTGEDHPCDSYEYCHAWFNGVYHKEPDASYTFYFTKK